MTWWLRALGWLWGNRRELARDAEALIEAADAEHNQPSQPLPYSAVAQQQEQIDRATSFKVDGRAAPEPKSKP